MKKKLIWLMVSCLMVALLLLASCAPAAVEEEEAEVVVTEEEVVEEAAEEEEAPPPMVRGTVDPDISVDVYEPDLVWAGTTLLPDNHNSERPRIIEVNMLGEIIWEYPLPPNLKQYTNPGFDPELLSNKNILLVLPGYGVHEINRNGDTVWSYLDKKVSHDADRLPNGNTIFVFGNNDQTDDAQVKEVNPEGEIVWEWYARDYFDKPPFNTINNQGWTHTNAVTRMANGNTLISPRNFGLLVEVDAEGEVVRTIGGGVIFGDQTIRLKAYENADPFAPHDPEVLPNGNILMMSQYVPNRAIEMVPETGEVVWEYTVRDPDNWPVRDADRLPNGNTLITGTRKIIEVTPEGKIVWQLTLDATFDREEAAGHGFYKAERIGIQ